MLPIRETLDLLILAKTYHQVMKIMQDHEDIACIRLQKYKKNNEQ